MSAMDCCGNTIAVGDYLAYATRQGSSTFLKLARVVELADSKLKVVAAERRFDGSWERIPRPVTLSSLNLTCRVRDVPEHVRNTLQ
jgi:hypothetical protein